MNNYFGIGLEGGPAPESFKLLRSWRRKGNMSQQAGALECILSAGTWPPDRKLAFEDADPEAKCPLCGELAAGTLHLVWQCPVVCSLGWQDIAK